jgi:hypothetical protein
MYLYLTEERATEIIDAFKTREFKDSADENRFFEEYGLGNTVGTIDRPFERLNDYEQLLSELRREAPEKYRKAHKGTPFGFMSWYAFDLRNYEKALFYMDAGISEDLKNYHEGDRWITLPGARFLLLSPNPGNPWLKRTFDDLSQLLEQELTRFAAVSGQHLDLASWRNLVETLLRGHPREWTLISALYVFLLESEDRRLELELREGTSGGSSQPFTTHLFAGGLLFESLLKYRYKQPDGTEFATVEGPLAHCHQFSQDFFGGMNPFVRGDFRADTLEEIHAAIDGSRPMETAFRTAGKLRNTTGHNLVRDNIFDTSSKYVDLSRQVMNAVFYVILKLT